MISSASILLHHLTHTDTKLVLPSSLL